MWGLPDKATAEELDRCLNGEAEPTTDKVRQMLGMAGLLAPKQPTGQTARQRAFDAMMREADRQARPVPVRDEPTEDLADPGVHALAANLGDGRQLRACDIEELDGERLEAIARNVARRLGQQQATKDHNL
jgi:hypothetical protein